MRIAFFDPFSGASGDMILGALIDAGLPLAALRAELGKLNVSGYDLRVERVTQHSLSGTRVTVAVSDDAETARDWKTIRELIGTSALDAPVRDAALGIFARLAAAEAKVHGTDPEHVHFHEVGGVDAIVDICGACIGLALLGVEAVYSGPPRLGSGFAHSQHGIIPIPAPATAALLADASAPITGADPGGAPVQAELLTPTGAAILTTLAQFTRPDFVPSAIGYGLGARELPWPNALRVWLGDRASGAEADGELILETNLDDFNPQFYELLSERLFAAGALDVWLTPIVMKKGRPATQVSLLCAAASRATLEDVLIANSSTLGVRAHPIERVKAARRIEIAVTRWGDVRIKLRVWQGRVIDVAPEYDDCLALARQYEVPLREVWNEAHRIGEAAVGRKFGVPDERRQR
ncbi:MAG: nickel pincer cofactor biosynthesis protein LarC [Chloroflexota bacterium]|nr:nickel pincer cofactor biosynthesis protein LarC [Chloroflexota bacterium]